MNEVQQLEADAEVQPAESHNEDMDREHAHPGPRQYVVIALILGVITAIEVALYYTPEEWNFPDAAMTATLFVLSIGKFVLVALYFMHLKFDNRIFTTFFAAGIVTTIAAFIAVLAMFRVLF